MGLSSDELKSIEAMRENAVPTRRVTVPAMEDRLYRIAPVLDHGFVRVIDYMGGDESVVQSARVSFGVGTKRRRDDEGLIRYLMRNRHTSPFEMCELKLHVKLPIFVARQWIRHRTASINEYSARYSVLDDEFYIPDIDQLGPPHPTNRQGRGRGGLSEPTATRFQESIEAHSHRSYDVYSDLLGSEQATDGLAREIARIVLPVNVYTQWYWKIDLHNLLSFLRLRLDNHAQAEIREYAQVIESIVREWVPLTYKAFKESQQSTEALTKSETAAVLRLVRSALESGEIVGSRSELAGLEDRLSKYLENESR